MGYRHDRGVKRSTWFEHGHSSRRASLAGVRAKFPALSSTDGHNIDARSIDKSAQQFVRGVMWPDDPKGWLFDDDSGTEDYSSGLKWYVEFDAKYKDQADKLIGRSHYGDLQRRRRDRAVPLLRAPGP
jgi:hypothetical protein